MTQPATFDSAGAIVPQSLPAERGRAQSFAEDDSATTRAWQLETMQKDVSEATENARGNRWNSAKYFENFDTTIGSQTFTHGLGRDDAYVVGMRWQPTVPGTNFGWEVSTLAGAINDANNITILFHANGIVTLAVL